MDVDVGVDYMESCARERVITRRERWSCRPVQAETVDG